MIIIITIINAIRFIHYLYIARGIYYSFRSFLFMSLSIDVSGHCWDVREAAYKSKRHEEDETYCTATAAPTTHC
jgi:hypothetical protein